jgi:tetratricopeptide (TPR) repeat protein
VQGEEHISTLTSLSNLAGVLRSQGKLAEAEPYLREALERRRRVQGDQHPDTLRAIRSFGLLLSAQGRLSDAEPYFREALETRRRGLGEEDPDTLRSFCDMGGLLIRQHRYTEALELLMPAQAAAGRAFARADRGEFARFLCTLGRARVGLGYEAERFAAAEADLLEAHTIVGSSPGPHGQNTDECIQALIELYDAWHQAEPGKGYDVRAGEWRARLGEWQASTQPGTGSPSASQPGRATAPS